jgi:hypothetical protein
MDDSQVRRMAGRALAGGLSVAAAVAIVALLSDSFDDTDWKIVGSSLGFSVFSSTAAAGVAGRRGGTRAGLVGALAAAASVIAFGLLLASLWVGDDADNEDLWRAFGVAGLLALWTSHAALMLRGSRPDDTQAIRILTAVSIGALAIDSGTGILGLLEVVNDVDEGAWRVLGALVVLTILSTVLVPILRRVGPSTASPRVAVEIADVARRLGAMDLPPEARPEVARLHELARSADRR